jgi:hypothetical protein
VHSNPALTRKRSRAVSGPRVDHEHLDVLVNALRRDRVEAARQFGTAVANRYEN